VLAPQPPAGRIRAGTRHLVARPSHNHARDEDSTPVPAVRPVPIRIAGMRRRPTRPGQSVGGLSLDQYSHQQYRVGAQRVLGLEVECSLQRMIRHGPADWMMWSPSRLGNARTGISARRCGVGTDQVSVANIRQESLACRSVEAICYRSWVLSEADTSGASRCPDGRRPGCGRSPGPYPLERATCGAEAGVAS
jgi:hypothetical protein